MKDKFIIFLVFLVLISIAGVSAVDDAGQTDIGSNFNESDFCSLSVQEESLSASDDADQTDFDKSDSECCSFVIQEKDETVFAFRQDSPINGREVVIHNKSLEHMEVIVQEINAPNNHFIQAIITEDGWIVSHGGDSSNVSETIVLENLAFKMLTSKDISQDSLSQIQKIFKKFNYGHFFIKAPDGRYAVAYSETIINGKLNPGEFLAIPNFYDGFRKGNYSDYAIDPVDAIVEICSYEDNGWNRRNIYAYDYRAHDTATGQKYGVDVYVSNDNGQNVGLNTSELVDICYFNDARYSQSSIPQNPERLYIATHIFEKQSIGSIFEVVSSPSNLVVGSYSFIRCKINNIIDGRVAVFDFDGENVEFINAIVFQGNYYYDSTQNKLYWNMPATECSKEIILSFLPKAKGPYIIRSHVEGIDEELHQTYYVLNGGVVLKADNVTTYKTYFRSMNVYLTGEDGVALIGEKVSITINGVTYWREVTSKGYASLSIMLQPGEYDAIISYEGLFGESEITSKIIVKKTLLTENLVALYGNASTFNVYCLDENGNALEEDSEIDFCIDGFLKSRYTNDQGICSLNLARLNLSIGNHSITTYNIRTNEIATNWIYISGPKTELVADAVTATYNINKNLVITLKDSNGKSLSGFNVTVDLNGVKTYVTDKNGQVKINVAKLIPKTYTAKVRFEGYNNYEKSVKDVKVTVIKATSKITAKKQTYKAKSKSKKFTITLKDSNGKAIKNMKVSLKLMEVAKKKTKTKKVMVNTNKNGKATFKIQSNKKGKYMAVISFAGDKYYNGANKKVQITIK